MKIMVHTIKKSKSDLWGEEHTLSACEGEYKVGIMQEEKMLVKYALNDVEWEERKIEK